jgi:hypothetical protein
MWYKPGDANREKGGQAMNRIVIFVVRAGLGLVGGFLLQRIFFEKQGWELALILAGLVVVAAYASEGWRKMRQKEKDQS